MAPFPMFVLEMQFEGVRAKGGAPVKASGEDIELELEMEVSQVGGRWMIVR
jgi:hypothetical protein